MRFLARLLYRANRLWWSETKPITVGVRAFLIREGTMMLVRHTYQDAWYLVGADFTLSGAMDREIERVAFYDPHKLPEETSPGTRRRVQEYLEGRRSCVGDW